MRKCDAVAHGELPENQYHLSINTKNYDLSATRVEEPRHLGQQTVYPTFLPLNMRRSPEHSMGGTFTLTFNEGSFKEIKWYNLIYHVLRGVSEKKHRAGSSFLGIVERRQRKAGKQRHSHWRLSD